MNAKLYNNLSRFGGIRYAVLDRDNHKCTQCGFTETDHLELYKKELSVHHLDENTKNNTLENLITLCCECHTSVHAGFVFSPEYKSSLLLAITKIEKNKKIRMLSRNREILEMRSGGNSLRVIGNKFGISRERVRQIINICLRS